MLVCFGSSLSGLEERTKSGSRKSILSIDLQPQNPNTNHLSTWQSPEASGRQPASWDKDNLKQHYLPAFICISKIPATQEVIQTAERVCSNSEYCEFKELPINKQQKLTSKNGHTQKKGEGVFCGLLFLIVKNF